MRQTPHGHTCGGASGDPRVPAMIKRKIGMDDNK